MEFWVSQGANDLRIYDGNFFLARQRMIHFSNAILTRGLQERLRWSATGVRAPDGAAGR